jgi:hypothetical protein
MKGSGDALHTGKSPVQIMHVSSCCVCCVVIDTTGAVTQPAHRQLLHPMRGKLILMLSSQQRYPIVLHGTNSQKTHIINTVVKACHTYVLEQCYLFGRMTEPAFAVSRILN